jgi:hypothetical protein
MTSGTGRSKTAARSAVLFGILAVLAIPAGVIASNLLDGVVLLHALYVAVPAAFLLGLIAWLAARKARYTRSRSINPTAAGPVRLGRFLAGAGLYLSVTGALALAFYAVLNSQR